jgi:alpha-L-fucosidase
MRYENNWQSLNSRPVPGWFEDAKLGIFIHWGLYSVPAYAPIGDYAEWYGYALRCAPSPEHQPTEHQKLYQAFHKKYYGEDFRYEDFVPRFTARHFDADEWAQLFRDAGAKYINLVSKHHDGFCLYQTDYAWNWNSVDVGPHRDFCAELKAACDRSSVRFGVYHSIYEWYNPLYLQDPERYALEHLIPMLKELVTKYEPSTLFTDGEWDHESSVWHSTDFLTWLYNESPVRDFIVPNDRWGKETRGRLGGNLTTEYGLIDGGNEVTAIDRVSEECRGIGASFGWNRFERPEHYLSEDALIKLFVDLISRGSNLLLNVGPTPDGRIPVIMQERLRQLGAWLAVNGEGVYGSRKYRVVQEGDLRYTRVGDTVYAWLTRFPFGGATLDVPYGEGLRVSLLGAPDFPVSLSDDGGRLRLTFGAYDPAKMPCRAVYGFRIER